jgi:hypothetical protein
MKLRREELILTYARGLKGGWPRKKSSHLWEVFIPAHEVESG